MKRRTFLIGISGSALAGSALLGSGAFSRVEATRNVRIDVAPEQETQIAIRRLETLNSQNYTGFDDNERLYVHIGANPNGGDAVNSNSATYFDDLFELSNLGTETQYCCVDVSELEFATNAVVDVYVRAGDGYRHSIVCPETHPVTGPAQRGLDSVGGWVWRRHRDADVARDSPAGARLRRRLGGACSRTVGSGWTEHVRRRREQRPTRRGGRFDSPQRRRSTH